MNFHRKLIWDVLTRKNNFIGGIKFEGCKLKHFKEIKSYSHAHQNHQFNLPPPKRPELDIYLANYLVLNMKNRKCITRARKNRIQRHQDVLGN